MLLRRGLYFQHPRHPMIKATCNLPKGILSGVSRTNRVKHRDLSRDTQSKEPS